MGLVPSGQHDGVHGSVSVCSDYLFKQRGFAAHDSAHGIVYEQPAVFLWTQLCGGIPADGKTLSVYGAYNDRRNVCGKLCVADGAGAEGERV